VVLAVQRARSEPAFSGAGSGNPRYLLTVQR
jgi:hypothetical protein